MRGLEGIKEVKALMNNLKSEWGFPELNIAIIHSLLNVNKLITAIQNKEVSYHFGEVMAYPVWCFGE